MKAKTRKAGLVPVVWALAACASPGSATSDPSPRPDTSDARLHVYEVPVDQIRDPGSDSSDPSFIEVNGSATVEVEADRAIVTFAVESRAETAADAAGANADLMTAVLGALRAGGFPGLELETFGYTLRPEYQMPESRVRTIAAYTALNNVRATATEVDRIGGVIDAAIAAGANRIAQLSFEASDTREARAEALAEAVRAARAEAVTIAETLGHELGPALEVRGGAERPMPRDMGLDVMMMRAEAAPTPIEAGGQVVTAHVTIRFSLGPELPGR